MITKTVRLTGGSPDSIEDSVNGVLGRAAETLSDIQSFRVVEVGGTVDSSGAPSEYTVTPSVGASKIRSTRSAVSANSVSWRSFKIASEDASSWFVT